MNHAHCIRQMVTEPIWPATQHHRLNVAGSSLCISCNFQGKSSRDSGPLPHPWTDQSNSSQPHRRGEWPPNGPPSCSAWRKGQGHVTPCSPSPPPPRTASQAPSLQGRSSRRGAEPAPSGPSLYPLLLESGCVLWMGLPCPHITVVNSQTPVWN